MRYGKLKLEIILKNILTEYKMKDYLYGLWMAIMGRYPHKEVELLDFITVVIIQDEQFLASVPIANTVTTRYKTILQGNYRAWSAENISDFRDRLRTRVKELKEGS